MQPCRLLPQCPASAAARSGVRCMLLLGSGPRSLLPCLNVTGHWAKRRVRVWTTYMCNLTVSLGITDDQLRHQVTPLVYQLSLIDVLHLVQSFPSRRSEYPTSRRPRDRAGDHSTIVNAMPLSSKAASMGRAADTRRIISSRSLSSRAREALAANPALGVSQP